MGLNDTVSAERVHIGFFGVRNAGKSSVVNAVTAQDLAVVSDHAGTTTDPVKKAMELLPLGPAVIIDTPGIDDEGELGALRVKKTRETLAHTDVAVLVADASRGLTAHDRELIAEFEAHKLPFIVAFNKCDLLEKVPPNTENTVYVSAKDGTNVGALKDMIASLAPKAKERPIASDLVPEGGVAVLVVPIDSAAPKGRLILPQQQTIRDLLDAGRSAVVCRETELAATLAKLASPPDVVITDSQAFKTVAAIVPESVPLTSFSILMARYKGFLDLAAAGAAALDWLKAGDSVLISEGCTHHRQCEDIGSVKLPKLLANHTGLAVRRRGDGGAESAAEADDSAGTLFFELSSGGTFPDDLSKYSLVIHCGGCMLNEKEMQNRMERVNAAGVPVTNYGVAIAHMTGILRRSLSPLGISLG